MCEIRSEQIETLSQRANVCRETAKEALERNSGDLLDAFLWLESSKKSAPLDGGFYSTRNAAAQNTEALILPQSNEYQHERKGDWHQLLRDIGKAALNLLRHCTLNVLQIQRKDALLGSIPILFLILLFIVAYKIIIPLTIAGLILGCRFRFAGPDLEREEINHVMDQVSDVVQNTVDQLKNDLGQHGKK
jgi:hypothetical protein